MMRQVVDKSGEVTRASSVMRVARIVALGFGQVATPLGQVVVAFALIHGASASAARAWDPFRSENGDVRSGNERMEAGDPAGAAEAYDRAAAALPSEGGVHLDRGLALLAQGEREAAREAFERATRPPASPEIRAAASYDLGIAFYQEADAAANQEDHENAQRLFREAADAFRASLRHRPGNHDAGWNLELALRRIREEREEQERQEQEQEQNQDESEQQDEQNDGDSQDQDDSENSDEGDPSESQDDEDSEDPQDPQDPQDQRDQPDSQEPDGQDDEGAEEPESSPEPDAADEPEAQDEQSGDTGDSASGEEPDPRELPRDAQRVLDALENNEQSLEQARAHQRASRERRRVLQDW